jgi:hypothetical protein
MKRLPALLLFVFFVTFGWSQKKTISEIEELVTRQEVEPPIAFLAADEMKGRDTGSPELDIAANYIASYFQQAGIQVVPGADKYFQRVDLVKNFPTEQAQFKIGDDVLKLKESLVVLAGGTTEWSGDLIFVGYGSPGEMPADIKGKMIVAIVGSKESTSIQQMYIASAEKFARVKAAGGAGLVEYFVSIPFPWPALVGYFTANATMAVKSEGPVVSHIWLKDNNVPGIRDLKERKSGSGSLSIQAGKQVNVPSKNVVGMIEGSDPVLKKEYLIISAHYDHVGIGVKKNQDSIYNGARDNAIGTVGLMTAAKFFAKSPPKRSVLFLAVTGEEKGLLGSSWYADHPLVPLKQTVFDFDCDGAGYNDKTIVTVIGLERTSAEDNISKACMTFKLYAAIDPVPEQNLYERSDNYNFARKGVPAIDFSTGVKAFDAEIMKYYHQPADEVGTLDFDYLVRYYRAFIYANYLIANDPTTPTWNAGDKFEPLGKALYQK